MAQFTAEQIAEIAGEAVKEFDDGFQITDLFVILPSFMKIVNQVGSLTGEEKKATVLALIDYVLDNTDLPGPDFMLDPLLKKVAPYAIEMAIKYAKEGGETPQQ